MKPKITFQNGADTLRIDSTDLDDFPVVGETVEIGLGTYRVKAITSAVVEVEPVPEEPPVTAASLLSISAPAAQKAKVAQRREDEAAVHASRPVAKKK